MLKKISVSVAINGNTTDSEMLYQHRSNVVMRL